MLYTLKHADAEAMVSRLKSLMAEDYSDRNHAVCSKLSNVWQLLEQPPVITTAANLEKLKLGGVLESKIRSVGTTWKDLAQGGHHRWCKLLPPSSCHMLPPFGPRNLLQLANAHLMVLEEFLGDRRCVDTCTSTNL